MGAARARAPRRRRRRKCVSGRPAAFQRECGRFEIVAINAGSSAAVPEVAREIGAMAALVQVCGAILRISELSGDKQEGSCTPAADEMFGKKSISNIVIHSHFSLTLLGGSLRVRALFRLFSYSSIFDRPRTLRHEAGFCQ